MRMKASENYFERIKFSLILQKVCENQKFFLKSYRFFLLYMIY